MNCGLVSGKPAKAGSDSFRGDAIIYIAAHFYMEVTLMTRCFPDLRAIKIVRTLAVLFVLAGAACSGKATTQPAVQQTPVEAVAATQAPIETAPAPEATAAEIVKDFSVDAIKVDYEYTNGLITVLYPLYGSLLDDFVVMRISNENDQPAKVVVESEIMGYSDKAVDTVVVEPQETVEIRQNPRLIPENIDKLNVDKPAKLQIEVTGLVNGEEKPILQQTHDTLVYARRDWPWEIKGFTPEENFELLTSMVMPNDPAVEGLIRSAADYTDSGTMWNGYAGYVNDENGGVWDRLQAIWRAESEDYHLTYISTMVSYAPGDVQRIRLPAEVLDQRSGNCIETSLLFASAAEALELETALIRIPGHAFVAVRMDDENANYYFIETTMIGRADFSTAVDRAGQEFQDALPHLQAGDALYDWITIKDARAKGILPLPWK
jgi:hypothetical protein